MSSSPPSDLASVATIRSPPTITQVVKLARYQLRDYLRSRRFILMLSIVGVIGAIFTGLIGYYRPSGLVSGSVALCASYWGNGAPFVVVFAGIIFGADAIAGEFQNKTGYFLMGLPIRRVTVYAGKYIAAFLASLAALFVFLLVLLGNALFYFGGSFFPWQLAASIALTIVYLLALLGATFLFSSLFKTSTYATLVVAVLFLFGFTLLQDAISGLVKIEPWFVISYASVVIGNVFVSPYPPHIQQIPVGPGATLTVYNPTIPEGVGIMVGYFVLTTLLGLWLFEREEFS